MSAQPDPANLQGLILHGYKHHLCSSHMLFQFADARAFIGKLLHRVQSGSDWGDTPPASMLQISLTFSGMTKATNLSACERKVFPLTFTNGPEGRSALHDDGASDPQHWWHGNFATNDIDCIVHVYALTPAALDELVTFVANAGARELTRYVRHWLPDDEVHFGYRDGLSQPLLDANTINDFVIGYPGSPFEPGPTPTSNPCSVAAAKFAKDGCYLAVRVLSQDVAAFENFLDAHAPAVAEKIAKPVGHAREWLAAKLMGRWRNGSPLTLSPDAPSDATRDAANFSFKDDDSGAKCPLSSHARVSNPRDQPMSAADDAIPRLIRRGIPYGAPDDPDRGLVGIFLCGSLLLQFEKLHTWFFKNSFSPLFPPGPKPQDAVIGTRDPAADNRFRIVTPNGEMRLDLPPFVTTKGTAYCILPSMEALRAIAEGRV